MKKRGGGKAKGSAFEREVAKALSLWMTKGKDKTQLIRSVLSGGWFPGQKALEGWRHVGDLAPNGPRGEKFRKLFAVECKHRRDISLYDIWTRKADDTLLGWWEKLKHDAGEVDVSPLLIFRSNRMPTMVGMSVEAFTLIGTSNRPTQVAHFEWVGMHVLTLQDFLKFFQLP